MNPSPVTQIFLPLALGFIMFALGLGLTPADFLRLFARPRAVLAGLVGQVLVVPLLALMIASAAGLPGELALGLMILAACPGGASSGLITRLARGDTALSITLTAVTSVIAVASVPLVVDLAARHFTGAGVEFALPLDKLAGNLFVLTTLPVLLGMGLRHYQGAFVRRWEPVAAQVATLLFLLIVVATFASQWTALTSHFSSIGPSAALLNLTVMAAGWGLGAVAGLGSADRVAITVECGLQNAALGIYVATAVFHSATMTTASVIYALLMNLSAIALILARARYLRRVAGGAVILS